MNETIKSLNIKSEQVEFNITDKLLEEILITLKQIETNTRKV